MAEAAQARKADGLTVIDLSDANTYTDALVIATTFNERQARAVADHVMRSQRSNGKRPLGVESTAGWVLVDFGDVVLHVFHEDWRGHYDLDGLWRDAPRIAVPAASAEAQSA